MSNPAKSAIAKQYAIWKDADAAARIAWAILDKATTRLTRLAKMGRKSQVQVHVSDAIGLRITDEYRTALKFGEFKIFTPAYCKRYTLKEFPLDSK